MNYEDAEISKRDEKLATPSEDTKAVIISANVTSPLRIHTQRRPAPVRATTYFAVSRAPESDWGWNLAAVSAPSQETPPQPLSNTWLSLKAARLIPASEVAQVKTHQGVTRWRASLEQSAD